MKTVDIQLTDEERKLYDFDTEYVVAESEDEVRDLYASGYLPAFLPPAQTERLFYIPPRSLRVDLSTFEPSSENRRILRRTEQFTYVVGADGRPPVREQFQYDPIRVGKFCKDYFDEKFGKGVMSVSRIKRVFGAPQTTHVFEYKILDPFPSGVRGKPKSGMTSEDGERVGYVTAYIDGEVFKYTFAFYDLAYYKESLGIRMMLDSVLWAKEYGKKYIYLGSVRDEGALYKTQFKGWEFWDGKQWSGDKEELKKLVTSN